MNLHFSAGKTAARGPSVREAVRSMRSRSLDGSRGTGTGTSRSVSPEARLEEREALGSSFGDPKRVLLLVSLKPTKRGFLKKRHTRNCLSLCHVACKLYNHAGRTKVNSWSLRAEVRIWFEAIPYSMILV